MIWPLHGFYSQNHVILRFKINYVNECLCILKMVFDKSIFRTFELECSCLICSDGSKMKWVTARKVFKCIRLPICAIVCVSMPSLEKYSLVLRDCPVCWIGWTGSRPFDEIKTVSWNCSTNGNSAEVRRKNMISSWKSSHKKLLWNSIAWSLSNHRAENEDHSGNTHAVQKNHDGIRTKTNQNEIFSNEFHRDDCRVPFFFYQSIECEWWNIYIHKRFLNLEWILILFDLLNWCYLVQNLAITISNALKRLQKIVNSDIRTRHMNASVVRMSLHCRSDILLPTQSNQSRNSTLKYDKICMTDCEIWKLQMWTKWSTRVYQHARV